MKNLTKKWTRQRKTEDEYQVWANYGFGWEEVFASRDYYEAVKVKREYQQNHPSGSYEVRTARIKIVQPTQKEANNEKAL